MNITLLVLCALTNTTVTLLAMYIMSLQHSNTHHIVSFIYTHPPTHAHTHTHTHRHTHTQTHTHTNTHTHTHTYMHTILKSVKHEVLASRIAASGAVMMKGNILAVQ